MTALAQHPFFPPDTLAQDFLRKQELFGWLDRMGQELELSETRYLDAENKYQAVSAVLHGCPVLQPFSPQMFAQGSFALGTTVKPLYGDEHDLDFICLLPWAHHQRQSQRQIYDWVYQRLVTHGTYHAMVEPKNRCVRICYANEFHLDITPAVFNPSCVQQGLYVPDRGVAAWQASHPKGYVEWFAPIAALQPRFRTLEKALENPPRHLQLHRTGSGPTGGSRRTEANDSVHEAAPGLVLRTPRRRRGLRAHLHCHHDPGRACVPAGRGRGRIRIGI